MARQVETGIVISADARKLKKGVKDANKNLGELGKQLRGSAKEAKSFADRYRSSILAIAATSSILGSMKDLVFRTVDDWMEASKELNHIKDSQIEAIEELKKSAHAFQGSMGNIFIPILAAAAKALKPLIEGINKWIDRNRVLVGTKVIEWSSTLARILLSALAPAVVATTRVFSGLKMMVSATEAVIEGVAYAVSQASAAILEEIAIHSFQELHEAQTRLMELKAKWMKAEEADAKFLERAYTKQWELVQKLKEEYGIAEKARDSASKMAKGSAISFSEAQAKAIAEILKTEKEMKELEKDIRKVEKAIREGIDEGSKASLAALRMEIRAKKKAKESEKSDDKGADDVKKENAKMWIKAFKAHEKEQTKIKKIESARRQAIEAEKLANAKANLAQEQAMYFQLGSIIGRGPGQAMKDMIDGTKSATDAMKDMIVQTTIEIVKLTIAWGIQKAIQAGSIGGLAGGLLGALGTGVVGALGGLFNEGGYVKGYASGGGVDSVLGRLTPGEYVLPKGLVDNIRSGKAPARASFAQGGTVGATSLAGAPQINVQMQTFAVPSRGEFRRWYKGTVNPNVRKMASRGQL